MCLGIPGQIVEIVDETTHIAKVDVGGVKRNVNIGLLVGTEAGIKAGDWVLIHVGFALSKIDEAEAASTLGFLEGLGQVYEDELEQLKESDIA
jgi:hydrogenase expression/formation protein HypC